MKPVRISYTKLLMSLVVITLVWVSLFFVFVNTFDDSNAKENPVIVPGEDVVVKAEVSSRPNVEVFDSKRDLNPLFFGKFTLDESAYQVIEDVELKREAVKDAFKHAWAGYSRYAWGYDELKPVSNIGTNNWGGLGTTLIDSIDTIIIMGLEDAYKSAKSFVEQVNFNVNYDASTFETTIRIVGGLLSAYDLTNEKIFLEKAQDMTDRLLPAFNTPTGIPYSTVNLKTGVASSPSWSQGSSFLSEFGTLHLEFKFLSNITGVSLYHDKVQKINELMFNADVSSWDGLFPIKYHPQTGTFQASEIKFGARGDSFYEYLLKQYLQTGKTDNELKRIYDRAMDSVIRNLVNHSPANNLVYISEKNGGRLIHKMDHLACFSAGMLALDGNEEHLALGKQIMETCYHFYSENPTGLGPEIAGFERNRIPSGKDFYNDAGHYILRPETVESLMILYRVTGDKKYQEWGWKIFLAIEEHCKTKSAYSGVKDVAKVPVSLDDRMESFFMAETLKYLFLLFTPPNYISLEEFVFNTEAHPTRKITQFKKNL